MHSHNGANLLQGYALHFLMALSTDGHTLTKTDKVEKSFFSMQTE